MSTLSVFRSNVPSVLAAWEAWKAKKQAAIAERDLLRAQYPGLTLVGCRGKISGFSGYLGGNPEPGEGWRQDRDGDFRPALRTLKGKDMAAWLIRCSEGEPKLPGNPNLVFGDHTMHFFGAEVLDGWLYVERSCTTDQAVKGGQDLSLWEPVKLSAYYAAKEAAEATHV